MEDSIQHNIKCQVFLETDAVIKKVISKFCGANSKEKQNFSQDILLEVKALLSCSKYNSVNSDCLNCRYLLYKYLREYQPSSFVLHSTSQ